MALPIRITDRPRLYTAAQFMSLSLNPERRYELIRGIIQEMSHPGGEHMLITSYLSKALWKWIFSQPQEPGQVLPPGGFELQIPGTSQDTVRSPDLAYIPTSLVSSLNAGAIPFPPELAVEIYSPNDRPGGLKDKLADYQAAGWNVVWVIYPLSASPKRKAGKVEVYHLQESLSPLKTLGEADQLQGEGTLTGFSMRVKELFRS